MNSMKYSQHTRIVTLSILFSALSGLSGCAGMTQLGTNDPLPADKGMVVLQICNFQSLGNKNWDVVNVQSTTDNNIYSLERDHSSEFFTTGHYAGSLPPGTYQVLSFKSVETKSTVTTTTTAPLLNKLGSFRIETGRLTDLGTVVYYPKSGENGKVNFVALPIGGKESQSSVKKLNPVAYAAVSRNNILGWQDLKLNLTPAMIAGIMNNLPHLNHPFEAKDGDVFFGGLLGKIYVRSSAGKWKTLDTGTMREIFRVEKAGDSLYATGENLLLKSSDSGKTWQSIALPIQNESLQFFHIGTDGKQYLYFLADRLILNTFKLYSRDNDTSDWKLLTTDTYDSGKLIRLLPSMYHFSNSNKLQFTPEEFNNYSLADDKKGVYRDIVNQFHSLHYLDDGSMYGVQIGITLSPLKNPTFGFYDPVSGNYTLQKNWTHADINDIYFRDSQTGYVSIFLYDDLKSMIQKTTDGGKTWTALPNSAGTHFVYVTQDGTLLKMEYQGDVYSSKNDGATWTLEREVKI